MLTAQNNQPDDSSVQIDADLQHTIDQIAKDLEIQPSLGDSDQAMSDAEAQELLIAGNKVAVNENVAPVMNSTSRIDPLPSVDQAIGSAPTEFSTVDSLPSIDPLPAIESEPVHDAIPTVDPISTSDLMPAQDVIPTQDVIPAQDPIPEPDSIPTSDAPDDLGITEPIFSQAIPVSVADLDEAQTEELSDESPDQALSAADETSDQPSNIDPTSEAITPPVNIEETPAADDSEAETTLPTQALPDLPHPNIPTQATVNFVATNSFFDVLVNKGKISPEKAEELRQENLSQGTSYEELVLGKQLLTETDIAQAKAEFSNVPYIKLSAIGVDPESLTLLDEGIAKRYQALPFAIDKQKNTLKVAMVDPLDLAAVEFLKQKTSHEIQAYFSENSDIVRMINEYYAQSLSTEVTEALKSTTQQDDQRSASVELNQQSGAILRDAPINRIVENILDYAIKSSASDVHIEPQIGRTRVRYRIDGILVEKLILPQNVHEAVISRIKIMANLKIDEKRLPQDGRFNYRSNNAEIDLRTSTLPTVNGEKVVMRLLKKDASVPSLEDLGLIGLGLQKVKEAIKIPYGIILITGPTGSGKTTTLYSILNIINKVGVNIMTLEDPVEYQIAGVSQVQTNPKAGLTFASGLRSFLRQDPDIIMVGEIRDNETADLALQASLTGHLVFSTLHTNSSAGALPRLLDMEAEPFLLASSIVLSMGQRVVRRINEKYKEEYTPEPVVVEDIKKVLGPHFERWCKEKGKDPNKITLFRPSSKRPATEPEYRGRIGIFEVMPTSPEIASLILNRRPSSEIEATAIQQGMTLMKQDGYIKVLEGITTIEEILRVAEVG